MGVLSGSVASGQHLLLLILPLLLLAGTPAAARSQAGGGELRVEGRVLKDGVGQPGVEVTLHRVTREAAGAVGTTRSGANGAFFLAVSVPATDGFTVHFTTVDYLGVRYFGPALHRGEAPPEYVVEVFDTAAAATLQDSVRIVRREVMLLPEEGRGWEVNEVLHLRNEARRTLVSDDGLPTWEFRIPDGVSDFEVGEGEIAPDDLRRMDDRVFVLAPLQPGTREVFLRYRLPAGRMALQLPAAQPTDLVNVYVQQPSPAMEAVGLAARGTMSAEGVSFLRYSAAELPAGADLRLTWREAPGTSLDPTLAAITLTLLVLALGAAAALRHNQPGAPPPAEEASGEEARQEHERSAAVASSADQPLA